MKIQIEDMNGMSVFDYCRQLRSEGRPADELLEVYRGDMLSYTVTSLEWGAARVLRETSRDGFFIEKYKPMSEKDKKRLKRK